MIRKFAEKKNQIKLKFVVFVRIKNIFKSKTIICNLSHWLDDQGSLCL